MMPSRKTYNNAAFRFLIQILHNAMEGVERYPQRAFDDSLFFKLVTAPVAVSLHTTSFRLTRAMRYLEINGYIQDLHITHGIITFRYECA